MRLKEVTGRPFSLLPQVAFLDVLHQDGGHSVYTLLHNSAYSNNTQLFQEAERRIPVEDSLTVVKGFIGSYPNVFFQVNDKELDTFVEAIENLQDEADYARLVSSYGVRRTSPWFWRVSDKFHDYYRESDPLRAGLFDLNRYENR